MKKNIFLILILFYSTLLFSKPFTIVIDPGHGGYDPGCLGSITNEKTVTLAISKYLGKDILKNMEDVKVIYTRDKDIHVNLVDRPKLANKMKADLFISIHANHAPAKSAQGVETYFCRNGKSNANFEIAKRENSVILLEENHKTVYQDFNPNSEDSYIMFDLFQMKYLKKSELMATCIQNEIKTINRHDRGVRQAGFWVLHQCYMPSILIEVGFLSNTKEEKYLATSAGQKEIASSIYKAVQEYRHEYNRKTVNPNDAEVFEPETMQDSKQEKTSETDKTSTTEPSKTSEVQSTDNTSPSKTKPTESLKDKDSNMPTLKEVENKKIEGLLFRVQVFTIHKKIEDNPAEEKKVRKFPPVQYTLVDEKNYKYTCGESAYYNKIIPILHQVQTYYSDAFIVAFKDGKQIDLSLALNLFKNSSYETLQ